jgi:5-methylcytosine-specific restriction endonuclease McrA
VSKGWEGGSTWAWRKVRKAVLERDGYQCQVRTPGICVHHVRGKQHGDDPAYLLASCQACNLKVGDPNSGTSDPAPRPSTLL